LMVTYNIGGDSKKPLSFLKKTCGFFL